jgi:hypothetical protein
VKTPKPAPPPKAIPIKTDDQVKEKKRMELQRLQKGSGRASTVFSDVRSSTTNKMGGST